MPIPVIAGIPFLASVIGGFFAAIVAYFAKFVSKRVAVLLVGIGFLVAATLAFISLIEGLMSSVAIITPPWLSLAAQLVVPDNLSTCVSVLVTARIARWAYEWNVKIIQMKLF
jgi:hypothetical protein